MKLLTILLCFSLFSSPAFALEYEHHLGFGANLDTYKSDLPNNLDLQNNFRFAPTLGVKSTAFWGNVGVRTGAFLEWKNVSLERDNTTEIDLTAYYVSVPLNLQFNLNEKWSIFGGLAPRILLAKTCDQCGSFDENSKLLVNYSNLGISYKFGETFSTDVIFNQGLSENFDDLKINTAQVLFLWKL